MKKDKQANNGGLFGDFLDIISDIAFKALETLAKLILSLLSSAVKGIINNNPQIKEKQVELRKFSEKFLGKKSKVIKLDDIECSRQTSEMDSLGFSVTDFKDFTYSDYNSNVPLSTIIGPPGFGKTNLILNLIHRDLAMKKPFIVVDPKASYSSTKVFLKMGKESGRKVYVFGKGEGHRFNPLRNISSSQIVEALFRAFPNTHEFYGPRSKDHVMDVVHELRRTGSGIVSLRGIYNLIARADLAINKKDYILETQAIKSSLRILLDSEFGELFDDDGTAITIDQIRNERACLYVALPTLGNNEIAKSIGKLFLIELMNHCYEVVKSDNCDEYAKENPISFYIDEAGEILFPDFKSLASQCRECGVNLTIGTQTIADLDAVDKNFLRQIESYQANTWIFRVQNPLDAEHFSKLVGTYTDEKVTRQMQNESKTDMGSWREKESFILHPNLTKKIKKYQAILKTTYLPDAKVINLRNIDHVLTESNKNLNIAPKPIIIEQEGDLL